MSTTVRNQHGFGAIEGLLVIIAITLIVGVGYYVLNSNKTSRATAPVSAKTTPSSALSTKTPALSDRELIVKAVKEYKGPDGSQDYSAFTTTINTIEGNNAQGHLDDGTPGGSAAFIAHKDSTEWKVVFTGQQAPDAQLGQKYGLPTSWYIAN